MDKVTLDMIRLLKERTDIARDIGKIKKDAGIRVSDIQREDSLREKVVKLCDSVGLEDSIASRFLNFLIDESVRVQSTKKQTHLAMFLKAKSLEEQGKEIIHMEVGEPDFMPPLDVRDALGEAYDMGFVRYGRTGGMPQFQSALAKHVSERFGADAKSQNILVTHGARFSVFLAITTLLSPGDEIIVIEPAWPAYSDCAANSGVKVRTIHTSIKDSWEPSVDQIRDAVNPSTKMIVMNYPNNPTGKILSSNTQDEIISLAKEKNLYVLSDEVYSEYAPKDWKSILAYGYEKSIVVQSFSKSHAMTGFRIGFTISDSTIIDKMSRLQALCLTSVSEPIQYAAMKALDSDVSENPRVIRQRLEAVSDRAEQIGLEFARPDGAMYLFARAKDGEFNGTRLANSLLEHGLAVAPGEGFGEYAEFIRISACLDEKRLMKGMNILDGVLNR